MTGRDMLFTEDSIISAPYLTTRELALLCSYARRAVLTPGMVDTRAARAVPSASISGSSDARVGVVSVGEFEEDAIERAGVG
jgi:hypothetical protein